MFRVVAFDRRRVGTTSVNRDLLGDAVMTDRLAQESQCGFAIPLGRQQEVYRGAALSTARYKYFQAPLTFT